MFPHDLVPWNWGRKQVAVRKDPDTVYVEPQHQSQEYGTALTGFNPATFHDEIDRVFNDFLRTFGYPENSVIGLSPMQRQQRSWVPKVDITEKQSEYLINAELPGLGGDDIDISVTKDVLTIKGEKRLESEETVNGYFRKERRFGSFYREFRLPPEVDGTKIDASFKNGVLTISIPKSGIQEAMRNIPVRHG